MRLRVPPKNVRGGRWAPWVRGRMLDFEEISGRARRDDKQPAAGEKIDLQASPGALTNIFGFLSSRSVDG